MRKAGIFFVAGGLFVRARCFSEVCGCVVAVILQEEESTRALLPVDVTIQCELFLRVQEPLARCFALHFGAA